MLETLLIRSDSPPPEPTPGQAYGGGYYVGKIVIGGKTYALVASPKSKGESPTTLTWKTTSNATTGTGSLNDGWSNTQTMIAAGATLHPAANYCRNLNIDGYTDWYLPSVNELEILYRNLKPGTGANITTSTGRPNGPNGYNPSSVPIGAAYTSSDPAQTSITAFKTGGSEAFIENYYWSSTQYSSSYAWYQNFGNGTQLNYFKNVASYVRAVRKVLID